MWLMKIIVCQKRSDPVESEEQSRFRLPGVANLWIGFIFVKSVNFLVFQERTRLCDEDAVILARSMQNRNDFFVGRDGRRIQVTQFNTSGAREVEVSVPSTDVVAPRAQRNGSRCS